MGKCRISKDPCSTLHHRHNVKRMDVKPECLIPLDIFLTVFICTTEHHVLLGVIDTFVCFHSGASTVFLGVKQEARIKYHRVLYSVHYLRSLSVNLSSSSCARRSSVSRYCRVESNSLCRSSSLCVV